MNKLTSKVLVAILFIPLSFNHSVIFSMDINYQNQEKSTHIPTEEEIIPRLKSFCGFVKECVDKDTITISNAISAGQTISDERWRLDVYQADRTTELENEMYPPTKLLDSKIQYCSDRVSTLKEITLNSYVDEHSKTCKSYAGTCKNLSSELWFVLYRQGIHCGIMFVARPSSFPSRYPDHVAVIFSIKDDNGGVKYYVADPRLLQMSFNKTFLLQKGKMDYFELKDTPAINDFNKAWVRHISVAIGADLIPEHTYVNSEGQADPLQFLLIPLDKYVDWLGSIQPLFKWIKPVPISIATDPDDHLHIRNELNKYASEVGPKTLNNFKNEVEKKLRITNIKK